MGGSRAYRRSPRAGREVRERAKETLEGRRSPKMKGSRGSTGTGAGFGKKGADRAEGHRFGKESSGGVPRDEEECFGSDEGGAEQGPGADCLRDGADLAERFPTAGGKEAGNIFVGGGIRIRGRVHGGQIKQGCAGAARVVQVRCGASAGRRRDRRRAGFRGMVRAGRGRGRGSFWSGAVWRRCFSGWRCGRGLRCPLSR